MGGFHCEGEAYHKSSGGRILGRRHIPDGGQVIPIPGPHKRVVFVAHFVRRLGFPLHPFIRGLMFYYRLDFHDLAPNFVLNISAFIVVCEAFVRIRPHFGMWLKTFNIKSKVVVGQQAECGGAMVGKMPNVTWIKGSYLDTIKGGNQGGSTSPSLATPTGQRPPNFDPEPPCGSPPGKRRAWPGVNPQS